MTLPKSVYNCVSFGIRAGRKEFLDHFDNLKKDAEIKYRLLPPSDETDAEAYIEIEHRHKEFSSYMSIFDNLEALAKNLKE